MKIWIGITDDAWFQMLRTDAPDEVNFWQPSGRQAFRVLQEGEPFLFKLHSPNDYIVGGGFFVSFSPLPASLAWDALGPKNGVGSFDELLQRIRKYREDTSSPDPVIGCNVLTSPFFWHENEWIPVPEGWARNIVRGKTYDTNEPIGRNLWEQVQRRLISQGVEEEELADPELAAGYGKEYLRRCRLGQGGFRILVTEAYQRRCALTGERTLPVLDAAHIKPYSRSGPHRVENGLLFRSDIHKLFDLGYLTVTPELVVEVSRRIKEDWKNGREYYAYHGQRLVSLPEPMTRRPSKEFLDWHNDNVFRP